MVSGMELNCAGEELRRARGRLVGSREETVSVAVGEGAAPGRGRGYQMASLLVWGRAQLRGCGVVV